MNIYSITYYLKEETSSCSCEGEHNHDEHHHHEHHHRDDYPITGNIKSLGTWAHIMPTTFLVKTDKNSEEILSILKGFIEEQDIIFVNKVDSNDVASTIDGAVAWIKG